jgi:hypothetical protein
MKDQASYYTLLAGLPPMPVDYELHYFPISRIRLEDRLGILEEEAGKFVETIIALLDFETTDSAISEAKANALFTKASEGIDDQDLKDILAVVINVRDIVAALRARKLDRPFPSLLGEYKKHIHRNWNRTDFRLGQRFSWIMELHYYIEGDEILAAERKISAIIWSEVHRRGERHFFTLHALLAYLIQWQIADGWAARDLEKGKKRFGTLLEETLKGYEKLFE